MFPLRPDPNQSTVLPARLVAAESRAAGNQGVAHTWNPRGHEVGAEEDGQGSGGDSVARPHLHPRRRMLQTKSGEQGTE